MGEDAEGEEGYQLALRRPLRVHCTIPESTEVCLRVVLGGGGGGVLLGSGGGRCWKTENEGDSGGGLSRRGMAVRASRPAALGGNCPLLVTPGRQLVGHTQDRVAVALATISHVVRHTSAQPLRRVTAALWVVVLNPRAVDLRAPGNGPGSEAGS